MYRLTVIKNMRTKVDRVINITETVQTEVEFPKYTRDDFSFCKHDSFDKCVLVSVGDKFASIFITHNNKGSHLFDTEITGSTFNEVIARVSAMIMPELQPKQEDHYRVMAKASELLMQELQQKQEETI